jgi:hypothetical protein
MAERYGSFAAGHSEASSCWMLRSGDNISCDDQNILVFLPGIES